MADVFASEKAVRDFAEFIGKFKEGVSGRCDILEAEAAKVLSTMDGDSGQCIRELVRQIKDILENGTPALNDLRGRVEIYADFLGRLKAITQKG